jgi:glutathione S-transferase
MFGAKAEIAAHEKGIPFERIFVPFSIATFYEPKHPEVLRINPKAQVPVLVDGDLELFDSTQIFEYLEDRFPEPALWPADPRQRARARLLELRSDEVFFPDVALLIPRRHAQPAPEELAQARTRIHRYYEEMDRLLAGREHLAGGFSYADIAFCAAQFHASFLGEPPGRELTRLHGWRARMLRRPAVERVLGPMTGYLHSLGAPAAPAAEPLSASAG